MEPWSKRYLRRRFSGRPFFYLLICDGWFRLAFVGFLGLVISLSLLLPRLWRTSPLGFRPVIKVSGLGLLQARSLKRSALKAMAEGRNDDAHYAWMAAMAYNPADANSVRGILQNYLQNDRTKKLQKSALQQSFWLLALTGTNSVDLELVSQVLEKFGQPELVINLIEPKKETLTPRLEESYLKALFEAGRSREFDERWRRLPSKISATNDLHFYRAAVVACTDRSKAGDDAIKTLESAFENFPNRVLVCRLLMKVYAARLELARHSELLEHLKSWHADSLKDHLGHWRLLYICGQKNEAIRLAENVSIRSATIGEILTFADFYEEWALHDQTLRLLKDSLAIFSDSVELWVACSKALLETRDWDELRRIAVRMRLQDGIHNELTAYSYYLEGRAELGLQRHFSAEMAFRKIRDWEFSHAKLALKTASDLMQLGYAELAREILLKLEKPLANNAEFWATLFQAAEKLKQPELMLQASRRAFQLNPRDPIQINNYAASLLILRDDPAEAIHVTFLAKSQSPGLNLALINHGAALMLNGRLEEAESEFRSIDPLALNHAQRTLFYLDLFELRFRQQQFDKVWLVSDLIDLRNLYAPQKTWFEEVCRELPPRNRRELTLQTNDQAD